MGHDSTPARPVAPGPRTGRLVLQGAKWLVTAGLVTYLCLTHKTELIRLVTVEFVGHPGGWLGVAACLTVALAVMVQRQRLLLRATGTDVPYGFLFKVGYTGMFANNFLPAGLGADICRLACLRGRCDLRTSELGAWVLTDKLVGIVGLIGLCALVIGAAKVAPMPAVMRNSEALTLLWVGLLLALLTLVPFLAARSQRLIDLLAGLAEHRFRRGQTVRRVFGLFDLYSRRPWLLLGVVGLSVLHHLLMVLGVCLIAGMFFGEQNALVALVCAPLVMLSGMVPVTPGNIGWTEIVASSLWGFFHFQGGFSVFLTWRVVCMLYSLGGCLPWLRLKRIAETSSCAG